jgi:haloalkane dehalogenase
MDAWFEAVVPTGDVTFVVQDWGAALAFDWFRKHPDRVSGMCYGEAMVQPRRWSDIPEDYRERFQWFRTEEGFAEACERDYFVEEVLPKGVLRGLDEAELDEYRTRHNSPDGAIPSVQWPVEIPFDGEPEDCHRIVQEYADFLEKSQIPKLLVETTEGHALTGRNLEFCRGWPNQETITLDAAHYYPEDCPNELGEAVASWYEGLS